MADEVQTGETNSAAASPTDASVATGSGSSTTTGTEADAGAAAGGGEAAAAGGDPLGGGSILGDAKPAGEAKEGDAAKAEGGDAGAGEGGDKGGEGDAPALTGAPEGDYELSGLPEGTVIDKAALDAVSPVAKELNLSNAGLSKIASVYAEKVLPAVAAKAAGDLTQQVVAQRAAWDAETRAAISGGKDAAGEAVKADPVYGGKSFDDVTGIAAKSIDRFGGADFRAFLKETGLGNHPAMMRYAYQTGALIAEDTDFVRSGDVPNTPRSREEKYYGARAS